MLIIENGNQIPNANSFVTDAEFTAYATARNLTVGATVEDREASLLLAVDYLTGMDSTQYGWADKYSKRFYILGEVLCFMVSC